ncbi:MAG: cytochrome c [Deltaproteobacteria bacterium]|nr:cytochrome c [Deltaproteobacteria bacterium]
MKRVVALALAALLGSPLVARARETEKHDYLLHCSGCHRPDASGTPGTVPSLFGIDRFARSEEGRAYLVGVPGVAQAPVSDERLAALLNWLVREHAAARADEAALPFTAGEVARLRAAPLRDPAPVRARVIGTTEGIGEEKQ